MACVLFPTLCCALAHTGQIVQQKGGAGSILEYFWAFINAVAFFLHVRIIVNFEAIVRGHAELTACY